MSITHCFSRVSPCNLNPNGSEILYDYYCDNSSIQNEYYGKMMFTNFSLKSKIIRKISKFDIVISTKSVVISCLPNNTHLLLKTID